VSAKGARIARLRQEGKPIPEIPPIRLVFETSWTKCDFLKKYHVLHPARDSQPEDFLYACMLLHARLGIARHLP
jgi:hypothetical protein